MSGATDKVRDRFDEGVAYARENFGKLGNPPSRKRGFQESAIVACRRARPAAARARGVGLAIGAAVAGAFRTSDLENEWVGKLSDDVKADLNTRAGAVSQSCAKPRIR